MAELDCWTRVLWRVHDWRRLRYECGLGSSAIVQFKCSVFRTKNHPNKGCWMWCSGSAFCENIPARPLHPVKFGQKWDPKGLFVRKYCPELKDMPLRYLFSPWKAPRQVQEVAKVFYATNWGFHHKNPFMIRVYLAALIFRVLIHSKCIIGEDYPAPIVDHNQVTSHNSELIRDLNNLSLDENSE